MKIKVEGKELIHCGDELHKSRTSMVILDVVFKETLPDQWDVYAVTEQGNEQIGAIHTTGNWVGSRDLIVAKDGKWMRPFFAISSGESVSKDKESFIAQWKGSSLYVRPQLPLVGEPGEIYVIGGDSLLIEGWLRQSKIWMQLSVETATRTDGPQQASKGYDLAYLNVAYVMAGYSIELLFKCLAWINGSNIRPVHRIRPFYQILDAEKKTFIEALVIANGWLSADDFIDYVDHYLDPVHRRYFGVSTSREFKGLNIGRDDKLNSLANAHQGIQLLVSQYLESRTEYTDSVGEQGA